MKLYVNVYKDSVHGHKTEASAEAGQMSNRQCLLRIDTETGETEILWSKPKRKVWCRTMGPVFEIEKPHWSDNQTYYEEDEYGNLIKLSYEEVTRRREAAQ